MFISSVQSYYNLYANNAHLSLNPTQLAELNKLGEALKGLGGGEQKHNRAWVDQLSSIIGSERLEIFVANMLSITGATLANVKPDGSDGGNFKLEAGEIIARDLFDYDHGRLMGGSISLANRGGKSGVLGNSYAADYGSHDKERTVHATIGKAEVTVGGETKTPEQLQAMGVNTDIAKAQEVTLDDEQEPIHFRYTEVDYQKANEALANPQVAEKFLGVVNEVTDSLSSAVQDFKDIIPEQPTGSAGLPGSDQDLTVKKEQLKNLGLQDDLIEKLISFTKKQDKHQPVDTTVTEEHGERKLLNIAITKGNEILSESIDLAEDYYGLGNVPDEVIDKIYSGKLAYINAEGKLDIADQPSEQFKNHQYLIELGVKSSKLVNVTEEFMAKHGGEASAVLVAMDVLSGGGLSAGKNLFKGVVGEKIFGELIEHGKEVAHEKLQTAIEKRFPYLSKHHSDALATILLTGGAITVGIGADFLKGGIRVGKRIDHPTPEMLADNYHPDWKFYKGTEYRDAGAKKVDGRPDMGPYSKTGGHHVHAKAAFKDHLDYNPNEGFSISNEFMLEKGLRHRQMTSAQQKLFKELKDSGRPNTMQEHTRIAVEALQAGGASLAEARSIVAKSLNKLRNDGIKVPTNIPWYND